MGNHRPSDCQERSNRSPLQINTELSKRPPPQGDCKEQSRNCFVGFRSFFHQGDPRIDFAWTGGDGFSRGQARGTARRRFSLAAQKGPGRPGVCFFFSRGASFLCFCPFPGLKGKRSTAAIFGGGPEKKVPGKPGCLAGWFFGVQSQQSEAKGFLTISEIRWKQRISR